MTTLTITDELFLVALNDRTGKHVLARPVLAAGLAAAQLAELVLDDAVHLSDRDLVIVTGHQPRDIAGYRVLERISAERHVLPTWLQYLSQDAIEQTAGRLHLAKIINRAQRGLLHRKSAYPPVNANDVAYRAIRLARALGKLGNYEIHTRHDRTLALLCHTTGLTRYLLRDADHPAACYRYVDSLHQLAANESPQLLRLTVVLGQLVAANAVSGRA